ncbi:MAG: hypothetical protein JO271_09505 [Verrucomicrobia bacterium]|nr:hypothetical protein [Verrucomicrobiota bacterium]
MRIERGQRVKHGRTSADKPESDGELDYALDVTEPLAPRRSIRGGGNGKSMIKWEDHDRAEYYVGKIGQAKFEINSGVGGMFGATFYFSGDCYAILSTARTVAEAKRFCEWVARGYGLDAERIG